MRVNQYYFLTLKKPKDSNILPKTINNYNNLVLQNYFYWWFLSNSFNFYKKLNVYSVFTLKVNYTYGHNYFFKHNKQFNLFYNLFVEC